MSGRLRRLDIEEPAEIHTRFTWDQRFRSGQVHPFRFVSEPRTGVKMRVCLDSLTLDQSDPTSEFTRQFLLDLRPEHYEVFRTPGDAPSLEPVPAFVLGSGTDVASVDLEAFGHRFGAGVHYPEQWNDMAQLWLGDRSAGREVVAVEAAEALHAHLFVTWSPALLQIRDPHRFKIAVVTPLEAMPILSSWCRGFGDYWDGHTVTVAWHYYWALARALTPNANPGFAALMDAWYRRPDGPGLGRVGQSALTRLASVLHALDDMYRAWQLPTDNATNDTISDDFDHIVLGVSGILDNLALLGGRYFGLSGLQAYEWSLVHPKYVRKLRAVGDDRATAVADYIDSNRIRLALHTELRHHAVHRDRLVGMSYRHEGEPQETRMRIFEPTLGDVWQSLEASGEDPADWGITGRVGPHDTKVSFVGQPERVATEHSPGEAWLDPMSFARLLVWKTARTTDDIFARLRLQDDPSLTAEDVAAIHSYDAKASWPFRPCDRVALILTSPVAGLGRS